MACRSDYVSYRLPRILNPLQARKFAFLVRELLRGEPKQTLVMSKLLTRSTEEILHGLEQGDIYAVCVGPNVKDGNNSLEAGRWVGLCNLQGPLTEEQYNASMPCSEKIQLKENETAWYGGRVIFKKADRNLEAFASLWQFVKDIIADASRASKAGIVAAQDALQCRIMAASYHDSNALNGFVANGGRIVRQLTLTELFALGGRLDGIPEELFNADAYTKPCASLYEQILQIDP